MVVGRLQGVEGGGGAGLDAHPVAEVSPSLLRHQQVTLIRILLDPAGEPAGLELPAQGGQCRQRCLPQEAAGVRLGGGAQQVIHAGAPLLAVPEVGGGGEAPGRVLLVRDEAAHQTEAEQHHDEGERQGGDKRHGLQRRQPPRAHQGARGDTEQQGPEQALPDGRALLALGGDVVDDEGPRVGGGDEEDADEDDRQRRGDVGPRQQIEEVEQQGVYVADRVDQGLAPRLLAGPDGRVAEHRHPQQVEGGGHEQHPQDEFAQGAPAGDAGDEEADEGGPGDPPGPVEQGPVAKPARLAGLAVGEGAEGELAQRGDIVAYVLGQGPQQVLGGAGHQHEQQQHYGEKQVQLGEALDPLVEPGDRRQTGQGDDDPDEAKAEQLPRGVHPGEPGDPRRQLQDPVTERGGDAEDGAHQSEDVHRVAERPVDLLLEDGVEA